MADDIDALVERLRNPPFGTETSERNLFAAAAATIVALRQRTVPRMTAQHIHAAMLARIYALMDAKAGTPEAAELSALADACGAYERAVFPLAGGDHG